MITQSTLEAMWACQREISTGEKLIEALEKEYSGEGTFHGQLNRSAPALKDAFGRRQFMQLGIPCGENSHRMYDVPPALAKTVILSCIAAKKVELLALNELAKIELESNASAPVVVAPVAEELPQSVEA
jgi:hypothetical protein